MTKSGTWKVGDLVRLKSGGPVMTVEGNVSTGYRCQWFAGKKLESGFFPTESLEAASKEPVKAPE